VTTHGSGRDYAGAVFVVPNPLPASAVLTDEYALARGGPSDGLGENVACMGDLDHDGRDDVAATGYGPDPTSDEPWYETASGEVWILLSDL
jgi:hypothetical protein